MLISSMISNGSHTCASAMCDDDMGIVCVTGVDGNNYYKSFKDIVNDKLDIIFSAPQYDEATGFDVDDSDVVYHHNEIMCKIGRMIENKGRINVELWTKY